MSPVITGQSLHANRALHGTPLPDTWSSPARRALREDAFGSPFASIASLVASRPAAVKTLRRHRVDFWCGGNRAIDDVCRDLGISRPSLFAEVTADEARNAPDWDWSHSSLATIVAVITERWHRPLEEELPRVHAMVERLASIRCTPRFRELADVMRALRSDIGPHHMFEECVLFPLILDGERALARAQSEIASHEHTTVAALLARMRALTDGFQLPDGAVPAQHALWHALAALAHEIEEHIAVEENVLLPRARAGEDPYRPGPPEPCVVC